MGDSDYSFSLTTFSPSGKLVQIEYALNAVAAGSTSLGIKGLDLAVSPSLRAQSAQHLHTHTQTRAQAVRTRVLRVRAGGLRGGETRTICRGLHDRCCSSVCCPDARALKHTIAVLNALSGVRLLRSCVCARRIFSCTLFLM